MAKDQIESKVHEAEQLFINGDIFSPSASTLTEYIQALLCYNARTPDAQTKYKSYANTLIVVLKVKKTSSLTRWLIAAAITTCIVGIIQIVVAYYHKPPINLRKSQQMQSTKELSKQENVLNNKKQSPISPK